MLSRGRTKSKSSGPSGQRASKDGTSPKVDDGPSEQSTNGELEHARVSAGATEMVTRPHVRTSFKNDVLYKPVNEKDPEIQALAASIAEYGVREPLVITLDNYILSGHRRYVGAKLAGLEFVPCRRENVRHSDTEGCRRA